MLMATVLLVDDNLLRASMRASILDGLAVDGVVAQIVRVVDAVQALCLVEDPRFVAELRLIVTVPSHGRWELSSATLTGPQLVRELRHRLPEVPVLVLGAGRLSVELEDIGGVYLSETKSPSELRGLVTGLLMSRRDEVRRPAS
jgi:CheY-like chemotaxis protein